MRKIVCLILAVLLLVSIIACDDKAKVDDEATLPQQSDTVSPPVSETDTECEQASKEVESYSVADTQKACETTEVASTESPFIPTYTGAFKTGYDRQDISPEGDIYLKNGTHMTSVLDPIYATCIAVNDGENTVLLFTIDAGNIASGPVQTIKKQVKEATGIPIKNILVSGTHSHSAPQPGFASGKSVNIKWEALFYKAVVKAAQNAIADLSDSEIHIGTTLATDMSFVRRWYLSDGSPSGIWRQNSSRKDRVAYESDSDDLCQFIRFVRKDKKDILLTSWGIHFTNAINRYPSAVSADINAYLRSTTENLDDDLLFAFYIAPSGNITLGPHIDGTGKYNSYVRMATTLAKQIIGEMDSLTRVNAGKISVKEIAYSATVRKDDYYTVEKAKTANAEIKALNLYDGNAKVYEVCAKYGFESAKEVASIVSRNKDSRGLTEAVPLVALSFGDIGFAGVPYEMFDTNGIELREASPFKMTIVITGCGGSAGYVPSALAVPNGGYEVYTTPWEFGTAEDIVEELVNMLKAQKK